MQVGDYIQIKGRHRDPGSPYSKGQEQNYNALVIELKPEESPFSCLVMKEDGTLWNIYEKQIIVSLS
jgi:hypothetical protein